MNIGKEWRLTSDDLNYTLERRKRVAANPNKGTAAHYRWVIVGYYSTLSNALMAMVDYKVKATELNDLKTIVSTIDSARTAIVKACESAPEPH